MRQKSDRVKEKAWEWTCMHAWCVCVCEWHTVSSSVKFVLQCCDTSDAYCAVLEECLPHVCSEPFVGIARHVGCHNGVIDESGEVCTHSGQVTAVCQPWLTIQLITLCICRC